MTRAELDDIATEHRMRVVGIIVDESNPYHVIIAVINETPRRGVEAFKSHVQRLSPIGTIYDVAVVV